MITYPYEMKDSAKAKVNKKYTSRLTQRHFVNYRCNFD